MSALDELIYDRTQTDVTYAAELNRKLGRGETLTAQELADWNAGLKGAYNATDMNRVDAAVREIGAKLTAASYPVRYTSPVPPPEPEYTPLSYIESTGTQYIDTGFKPNNNTTIVANVEITNADTDYIGLFGARDGSTKQMWAYYDTTTSQWSARYNTESKKINGNYSGKHTISIEKNIFVIDGTEYTFSAATFTSAYTAYIFAINSSGAVQYPAKMKIYDCQIYDNGVLVRDYISAIQNGSVGLYERVENKMYLNAGTGEFIAGKVVPQPEPPPLPVVTEFSVGDIINYDIWRTYLDNVKAIRDAYYTMPDSPELPEPTAPLTYDGANAIERLIYDILKLYEGMIKRYRICGTFAAGSDYNRQYIRSV